MGAGTCVVFADRDAWCVGTVARGGGAVSIIEAPFAADASPEARAAALTEALRSAGHSGRDVVLALASGDCLCAPVLTADLPTGRQRRQALLYRLEEKLPVAAEDVVADFIQTSGERALGVCVERRELEPIVRALEAAGARVGTICPAALLAVQHWLRERASADAAEFILWSRGDAAELFLLTNGAVAAWYLLPDEPADVALLVRMAMAGGGSRPARLVACGVRADVVGRVRELGIDVAESPAVDMRELATLGAAAVARGRVRPWVEFAGGGERFARGAVPRWLAAAVVLLVASLAIAMFVRAARYERVAAGYEAEQEGLFRRALPGQPVPADVRSRLASEAQAGTRGAAGGAGAGAYGTNLVALRDVMTHLPKDVRFRVYEMRVGDGAFTLEGEAASHGDADGVAAALRRRPGFEVEPPRTDQRAGRGVTFTINGSIGDGQPERRAAR